MVACTLLLSSASADTGASPATETSAHPTLKVPDDPDLTELTRPVLLETLVVTATRRPIPLRESPLAISQLSRTEIENRPAASVAELVRSMPGVMLADNSIAGMQRLRIRGEDARRSLVMIDGQEISDHSTFGPPLLIDPSLVERIEVVRGPASTLYGSRASGGVIHILTREPADRPFELGTAVSATGATAGTRASINASSRQGPLSFRLGAAFSVDHDRQTPSGPLENSETRSKSLSARLGWEIGTHTLALQFDDHRLTSQAPVPEDLVDGVLVTDFLLDMPRRDRRRLAFFHDFKPDSDWFASFHLDAWWQQVDRRLVQEIAGLEFPPRIPPIRYDYRNDDQDTIDSYGINLQTDWRPSPGHDLVAGLSLLRDSVDKAIVRTGNRFQGGTVFPADLTSLTRSEITTSALFIEDSWSFAPDWRLIAGLRQYFVDSRLTASNDPLLTPGDEQDSRLIGSVALVRNLSDTVTLRASWGQGYVYPTLLHLHTGSLFGQGNLTRPNPNLRPETSANLEVGARFEDSVWSADFTLFSSTAEDYLASVRASQVPGVPWASTENTFTNLNRAETTGAEFLLEARLPDTSWECYAQGTWLRRELVFPTFRTTRTGQPEWSGRAGLRWHSRATPTGRYHLEVYSTAANAWTDETGRSADSEPAWATLNLSVGVTTSGEHPWWIGLELNNLTDTDYRPATDELPQAGRHVNLGVRWRY